MNYEPNTYHWQKGDLVLHDADAKRPEMLMEVLDYTRDGLCTTRYIDPKQRRCLWENRTAVLHAPERFGVALPTHYTPNSNVLAGEPTTAPAITPPRPTREVAA